MHHGMNFPHMWPYANGGGAVPVMKPPVAVAAVAERRLARLQAAIDQRPDLLGVWPPMPPWTQNVSGGADDPEWVTRTSANRPAERRWLPREGRVYPCEGGEFRVYAMPAVTSDAVGVGVLCYQRPEDVERFVGSAWKHVKTRHDLLVFDNSEDFRTGEFMLRHAPNVPYVKSLGNVGTSIAKNRMVEHFAALGIRHFILTDQDVEFTADPVPAMLQVFREYPDTGAVAWAELCRTAGWGRTPGPTGVVPEVCGVLTMYSLEAIVAIGGWSENYFLYVGEDSRPCVAMGALGFKTRVIDGPPPAIHHHPGSGMRENPRAQEEFHRSMKLFRAECKANGWQCPL